MADFNDHPTKLNSDPQLASKSQAATREYHARDLLGEKKEATIIHAGEHYRLRITANNKLILTK
ncbi:hemin uptake protein HemP [Methylosinus sporium]|uniref:Hemin uptake protein HemP n=1 Tax=Methylosinus sporium TaxID=428 RepID=A0A549T0Y8_METSR|nr:hemin uptake protein HemP [Methylosinus sporium]TRL35544.1 hemin uptake protein HemP [Methylosinus sporium]